MGGRPTVTSRPLPILFVDHAPALGGAERSLLLLLKHLNRHAWQPHLACASGPLAEEAAALGVSVHVVPLPRLRRSPRFPADWLRGARALARLARQIGAVLLHANTVRAALYVAPAARLAGLPYVWHMRDFWLSEGRPRWPRLDVLGKRLLCGTAARVIANSRAVAAHLPRSDKITVVYNGVEVTHFGRLSAGARFRQEHGIPPDAPVVGTVGRLRPWKGHHRFLHAMARVARKAPKARFLVVGGAVFGVDDEYPQHLRRLAADLGLAEQVIFTGHLHDVRPALAAMDVFVHAGDPEPFGLVNVEALAAGKPVVAFAHGALPEIVVHGKTGLLVPPGDVDALAHAVWALLADPDRRRAMGRWGRERVAAHFSAEQMAQNVERVLVGALPSRPP